MANIKGQCHEILYSVLFIKQLLLVPSDKPKKDFEIFRIFKELFVFIIDSPVYSSQGNQDFSLYVFITGESFWTPEIRFTDFNPNPCGYIN
jgi:hypothetical protein